MGAKLDKAELNHADLTGCDLSGASLARTKLHGVTDDDATFTDRSAALEEDPELAAAESWKPRSQRMGA